MDFRSTYAPYDKMLAFDEGIAAYDRGGYNNPYTDVAAQAWDRGLEYAMKLARRTKQ